MTLGSQETPQPPAIIIRPTRAQPRSGLLLAVAWVFLTPATLFYVWRIVGIGLDLRDDFWTYWRNNREVEDIGDAFTYGDQVLHTAQDLQARQTQPQSSDQPPPDAATLTLTDSGPGLFDSPWNARIFLARWHRLRPLYGQIARGLVAHYDNLLQNVPDGDYQMDYPPMRLFVMTLWVWHVQSRFPGLDEFPQRPIRVFDRVTRRNLTATDSVAAPLLDLNTACIGISALLMFLLVWLWVERSPRNDFSPFARKWLPWPWPAAPRASSTATPADWRSRWGDPLLIAPVLLLGLFTLLRPMFAWDFAIPDEFRVSLIDLRVLSLGFWIFLVLRFLSAVCLARLLPHPFRGPACGLVAATLVWINPAAILATHGWPQWDAWVCPFLLFAALCVSVDCWFFTGLALGAGAMFKGQLLFIIPVLLLCPLLAGWPGKFLRILAGIGIAAGLILYPWLIANDSARSFIFWLVLLAAAICALSFWRRRAFGHLRNLYATGLSRWRIQRAKSPRLIPAISSLAIVLLLLVGLPLLFHILDFPGQTSFFILLLAAIFVLPWFMPRRMIPAWLAFVFAASLWLAPFRYDGKFSWFYVGFDYGAHKQQVMQLSTNSLGNLSSLLADLYGWHLHDPVMTLRLPGSVEPTILDIRLTLAIVYFSTILLCAAGAALHLRRRDPRFLIALTAPCVLLPTLLTQMSARYTMLSAVVAASMLAVSAPMSLLALLLTVLSCVMLGIKMIGFSYAIAPGTFTLLRPTYPGLGWVMLLVSAIFLYGAIAPRGRRPFPEQLLP